MKIIDFQYLLCANFYSNYSSKSPKGRDSIHTQISGSCNQMLSQINQGKSRACITPSILRKWSKSNSSLSSSENRKTYVQYVQRSRNSLVCFSHPKIKGFIASLYSRVQTAQQNGHWQSAARRAVQQQRYFSVSQLRAALCWTFPTLSIAESVKRVRRVSVFHCELSEKLIFSWVLVALLKTE